MQVLHMQLPQKLLFEDVHLDSVEESLYEHPSISSICFDVLIPAQGIRQSAKRLLQETHEGFATVRITLDEVALGEGFSKKCLTDKLECVRDALLERIPQYWLVH